MDLEFEMIVNDIRPTGASIAKINLFLISHLRVRSMIYELRIYFSAHGQVFFGNYPILPSTGVQVLHVWVSMIVQGIYTKVR